MNKRSMLPRAFLIWFFDHYKYYNTIQVDNEPLRYGWQISYYPEGTLDEIYEYWRLEIEPKNKKDENK